MKRFLSLALTLAMLLSSFSFAAPIPTPVAVEAAVEEVESVTQEAQPQDAEKENETQLSAEKYVFTDYKWHEAAAGDTNAAIATKVGKSNTLVAYQSFDKWDTSTKDDGVTYQIDEDLNIVVFSWENTLNGIGRNNDATSYCDDNIKLGNNFMTRPDYQYLYTFGSKPTNQSNVKLVVEKDETDAETGRSVSIQNDGSSKTQFTTLNASTVSSTTISKMPGGYYYAVIQYYLPENSAATTVDFYGKEVDAVKGEWTTIVSQPYYYGGYDASIDGATGTYFSGFFFAVNFDTADTSDTTAFEFKIDNIALYHSNEWTVTFDNGGNADATVPADIFIDKQEGGSVNLNDTALLAESTDDNKLFLGWSTVKGDGTKIVRGTKAVTSDVTYYAIFREKKDFEKHTEYGTLVMSEDFELVTKNIDGAPTYLSYVNTEFLQTLTAPSDDYPEMHANESDILRYDILSEEDGNKYVRSNYYNIGENATIPNEYVKFRVEFSDFITEGRYTYVANYKTADKDDFPNASFYLKSYTNDKNAHAGSRYSFHEGCDHANNIYKCTQWKKAVTRFQLNPALEPEPGATTKPDGWSVNQVYKVCDGFIYGMADKTNLTPGAENYEYDIDNFAIYYEPVRNITFDANGMEGVTAPSPIKIYGYEATNDFDAAAYKITMPIGSDKMFKGWSTTPDGTELVTKDTKFTQDATLYAVYGPLRIHPALEVEFEEGKAYTDYFSRIPVGNGQATAEILDDGTSDGAFARLTYTATDENGIYDTPMTYFYTSQPVYVNNIEKIIVRVRYNDASLSDNKSFSLYLNGVKNGVGSTATIGEKWVIHRSYPGAAGEWGIVEFDIASNIGSGVDDTTTFTGFRLDTVKASKTTNKDTNVTTYKSIRTGFQVDYDYIRFVLKDDVTLDWNTQEPFTMTATNEDGTVDSPYGAKDYRSGYFKLTYPTAVDADTVKGHIGTDLFAPESVTALNDEGTQWLVSAKANLANKTFTVPAVQTEKLNSIVYKAGYTNSFVPMAFEDGENLIPNGEILNPYYNTWVSDNSTTTTQIAQNKESGKNEVKVNHKSTWSHVVVKNILFKENTRYFFSSSTRSAAADNSENMNDKVDAPAAYAGTSATTYLPFQDGSGFTLTFYSGGNHSVGSATTDKTSSNSGYIQLQDEDYYKVMPRASVITDGVVTWWQDGGKSAQTLEELKTLTGVPYDYVSDRYFSGGGCSSWLGGYNQLFKGNGGYFKFLVGCSGMDATDLSKNGVTYYVTGAILKEMFPVTVDTKGAGEMVIWLAKDEAIQLPECTVTKENCTFAGYNINGVRHNPGDKVTASQFNQDYDIEIVWYYTVAPEVYATDATGAASKDMSDYRTGYYKMVFGEAVTEEVAGKYLDKNVFAEDSLKPVGELNEDAAATTWMMSLSGHPIGKTWTVNENNGLFKYSYTFARTQFNDGENLIANGDFSNPYYNSFKYNGCCTGVIKEGMLNIDVSAQHSTAQYQNIMFKENTKYFVSADMIYTASEGDPKGYRVDLYAPAQAGGFLSDSPTNTHLLDAEKSGQVQHKEGTVTLKTAADYAGTTEGSVDKIFTIGGYVSFYTGIIPPTGKTVKYSLDNVVLKEMFPVTVSGSETEYIWLAKNEKIKLNAPSDEFIQANAGEKFIGYNINGGFYKVGEEFMATSFNASDYTVEAVWLKPTTSNKKEIRTSTNAGIRFIAEVTYEQDLNAAEFGFMVTRQYLMDQKEMGKATNENFTKANLEANNVSIAWGKSKYKNNAGVDVYTILETKDDLSKVFTGVLTGIPSDMYSDVLVARPYILDKEGNYYYGDVINGDIKSIAQSFIDDENSYYYAVFEEGTTNFEKHQDFVACIDAIIANEAIPELNPKQN